MRCRPRPAHFPRGPERRGQEQLPRRAAIRRGLAPLLDGRSAARSRGNPPGQATIGRPRRRLRYPYRIRIGAVSWTLGLCSRREDGRRIRNRARGVLRGRGRRPGARLPGGERSRALDDARSPGGRRRSVVSRPGLRRCDLPPGARSLGANALLPPGSGGDAPKSPTGAGTTASAGRKQHRRRPVPTRGAGAGGQTANRGIPRFGRGRHRRRGSKAVRPSRRARVSG